MRHDKQAAHWLKLQKLILQFERFGQSATRRIGTKKNFYFFKTHFY